MYTTIPVANTFDLLWSTLAAGVVLTVVVGVFTERWKAIGVTMAVTLLMSAVAGYISLQQPLPVNTRVVAQFLGYQAESVHRGKGAADSHYVYGVFQVPEGRIAIHVNTGIAIPTSVVLYRN